MFEWHVGWMMDQSHHVSVWSTPGIRPEDGTLPGDLLEYKVTSYLRRLHPPSSSSPRISSSPTSLPFLGAERSRGFKLKGGGGGGAV